MEEGYLSELKDMRNSQMDVLRQSRPLTDEDQKRWFSLISGDKTQDIFVIKKEGDNGSYEFIGYCGITNMDRQEGKGEISFLVKTERADKPEIYRKDFLSTLYMLCLHGFEEAGLKKLYTETYIFREYHMKILEEFGFVAGETLKDRKTVKGNTYDSVIHTLLQNQWSQVKRRIKGVLEK